MQHAGTILMVLFVIFIWAKVLAEIFGTHIFQMRDTDENYLYGQRTKLNQITPQASVISVNGNPNRKYSLNPMCTSGLARSTTMIFATEPVTVKFPARVLDIANVSQPV